MDGTDRALHGLLLQQDASLSEGGGTLQHAAGLSVVHRSLFCGHPDTHGQCVSSLC